MYHVNHFTYQKVNAIEVEFFLFQTSTLTVIFSNISVHQHFVAVYGYKLLNFDIVLSVCGFTIHQ